MEYKILYGDSDSRFWKNISYSVYKYSNEFSNFTGIFNENGKMGVAHYRSKIKALIQEVY